MLAAGSRARFFKTPGAEEHSFPLYTVDHADRLRAQIVDVFDAVQREPALVEEGALTFVVVGAGATGTEIAGALAEMITHTMPVEFPDLDTSAARVVMVDHGDAVLGPFSEHAHAYAAAVLERDGVEVRLGTAVKEVGPGPRPALRRLADRHAHGHLGRGDRGRAAGGAERPADRARRARRRRGRT